ncbi:MAG TPA: MFS transporter [Candidatus Nitrosotenuis sp.]|jgi:cyanate permease|nr:MFS transporter [Candidatus Nitrosotenuis sp.]
MKPSPYRWVIEALLFSLYLAFGISWLAYAPLLKELEAHFGVGHARAGMLISLVSVSKAFVPLLAGLVAARLGLRRALMVGASLAGLAALAPLAPSFETLLGVRFLFGVGGAVVVTLMGAVVMEWFPRRELPMVNAFNNVAVNSGITLALFCTAGLAARLGWQGALVALGLVSTALALAWALLGREAARPGGEAARPTGDRSGLGPVLRRRETWFLALAFTGPLSLYLALNTWLPTHYQEAFGLDRGAASRLTGLFNLVGIPAALVGGWLTARLGLRRPLIVASGLLMPLGALAMVGASNPALRLAGALALGTSFFLYVAPLFTLPMELPGMTPGTVALMNGVVFSLAYVVSFFAPVATGWLKEATGSFLPGFLTFAALSASLALGGLWLPETGPGRQPRGSPACALAAAR